MIFSSGVFLFIFLPLAIIVYYNPFVKSRTFRNAWLLFMSLFFYAWGEPVFVFVMIGSIIINWALTLLMARMKNKKKIILIIIVGYDFLLFFIFKYLVFTLVNINVFFKTSILIPNIVLPIGISFFIFQLLSYVFDVYYEKIVVSKNLCHVALFVSLFPSLIAGPIVRYTAINEQITGRKETLADFKIGIRRFVIGLGKKVLLADLLAMLRKKSWLMS